jgi:hypothetical protein
MNDQNAMLLRYFMIASGSYLAGRAGLPVEMVGPIVDQLLQVGGGAIAVGGTLWGLYVKCNTKTVSAATGARANVMTLSPVTGKPE